MDLSHHVPLYLEVVLGNKRRDTSWRLNTTILWRLRQISKTDSLQVKKTTTTRKYNSQNKRPSNEQHTVEIGRYSASFCNILQRTIHTI